MENLIKRSLTALIFIVLFLGLILLGKYSFIFLCFLMMLGCLYEFYGFFQGGEHPANRKRGIGLSIILFLLTAFYSLSMSKLNFFIIYSPIIFLFPISTLFFQKEHNLVSSAITVFGIFYCAVPICLFQYMGFIEHGHYNPHIILGMIFFIWFNDTGAYVFGNIFGKHLIFKKISPAKTWEGFIGGGICTLIFAYFIQVIFNDLHRLQWIGIALIVVVMGTLGDFVESLYKREVKIKDAGKIFPGHGGMLDRFDSLIMAIPFVYFLLMIIKK